MNFYKVYSHNETLFHKLAKEERLFECNIIFMSVVIFILSLLLSSHRSVSSFLVPNDKQERLHRASGASSVGSCEVSGPHCCDRVRADAGWVSLSELIIVHGVACVCVGADSPLCAAEAYSVHFYQWYLCRSKCLMHFKLQSSCFTGQDWGMCPILS